MFKAPMCNSPSLYQLADNQFSQGFITWTHDHNLACMPRKQISKFRNLSLHVLDISFLFQHVLTLRTTLVSHIVYL